MPAMANSGSTLLLTLLLAIGLVFFLRAASKDRTTVVDVFSPKPAVEVLEGLTSWLTARGWAASGGDANQKGAAIEFWHIIHDDPSLRP